MRRFSIEDTSGDNYVPAGYLIAQFGKNFSLERENRILGKDLLDLAIDSIEGIVHRIGGGFVWLECEKNNTHALEFYQKPESGFRIFEERTDENGKDYYRLGRII